MDIHDSNNVLDDVEEEQKQEEVVRPTSSSVHNQELSPTSVAALSTLLDTLSRHSVTIKDFNKSLLWSNLLMLLMLIVIILLVQLVPASEEVLYRFLLAFKHLTGFCESHYT